MLLREPPILFGMGMLSAAAYVNVDANGGFENPNTILIVAAAVGVGVGSLYLGKALEERRYWVAALLGLTMICAELFGIQQTGERLIADRDAAQVPARQAQEEKAAAQKRVSAIESELATTTTTARLETAMASKAAADQAVFDQASLRGCASNCRKLLTKQMEAATAEVAAARSELQASREKVEHRLDQAKTAFASIKLPPSKTGLADRLSLPAWKLDLSAAALLALGINGLGCALLICGAHGPRRRDAAIDVTLADGAVSWTDVQHVARFGIEQLEPAEGSCVYLSEIRKVYLASCKQAGRHPLPEKRASKAMIEMFQNSGVTVLESDGEPIVINVAIRPERIAIPDLRNAAPA